MKNQKQLLILFSNLIKVYHDGIVISTSDNVILYNKQTTEIFGTKSTTNQGVMEDLSPKINNVFETADNKDRAESAQRVHKYRDDGVLDYSNSIEELSNRNLVDEKGHIDRVKKALKDNNTPKSQKKNVPDKDENSVSPNFIEKLFDRFFKDQAS